MTIREWYMYGWERGARGKSTDPPYNNASAAERLAYSEGHASGARDANFALRDAEQYELENTPEQELR